jgi:hypothetical protein
MHADEAKDPALIAEVENLMDQTAEQIMIIRDNSISRECLERAHACRRGKRPGVDS